MVSYKDDKESNDEESDDDKTQEGDISSMQPLEDDEEEIKQGKRIKILTRNKLLTGLPISIVQIKVRNNSNKLKNGTRQIV